MSVEDVGRWGSCFEDALVRANRVGVSVGYGLFAHCVEVSLMALDVMFSHFACGAELVVHVND
jgi:hypothetical protein